MISLKMGKSRAPKYMNPRVKCENGSCNKARKYYCFDHSHVLCNGCFTSLHNGCNCDLISSADDANECLETVRVLFNKTQETADKINAELYVKGLNDEIKEYFNHLTQIEENYRKAAKEDEFYLFTPIQSELLKLHKAFTESRAYIEILKYSDLREISLRDKTFVNDQKSKSEELYDCKEKLIKEMMSQKNREIKIKEKEIRENVLAETEEATNQLKIEIEEETKSNRTMANKIGELEEKIRKMEEVNEIEKQKHITELFNNFYESKIGKKIVDFTNYDMQIEMSDEKRRAFIKDLVDSKLKLPNICSVNVKEIGNEDDVARDFLQSSIPSKLDDISISMQTKDTTDVKMGYYLINTQ